MRSITRRSTSRSTANCWSVRRRILHVGTLSRGITSGIMLPMAMTLRLTDDETEALRGGPSGSAVRCRRSRARRFATTRAAQPRRAARPGARRRDPEVRRSAPAPRRVIYLTLPELLQRRRTDPGRRRRDPRLGLWSRHWPALGRRHRQDAYATLDEKAAALLHSLARTMHSSMATADRARGLMRSTGSTGGADVDQR